MLRHIIVLAAIITVLGRKHERRARHGSRLVGSASDSSSGSGGLGYGSSGSSSGSASSSSSGHRPYGSSASSSSGSGAQTYGSGSSSSASGSSSGDRALAYSGSPESNGYQFDPYITCWEQNEYSYWGYRDPEWMDYPGYHVGDVCDHEDPTTGELRDTCFFEVRIGEQYWSRKCTHSSACPKGPNACNFDDPTRIVCCCQQDYCNEYMEYAKLGYANEEDIPDINEQGKVIGSGGGHKRNKNAVNSDYGASSVSSSGGNGYGASGSSSSSDSSSGGNAYSASSSSGATPYSASASFSDDSSSGGHADSSDLSE